MKAGDTVDTAAISRQAQRMSALQDFDSVGYRLDGDRQSPTLTWLPREKTWGPDYLKVDLGVYASQDGDLTFALYGRHVRTWVNSLGAEWRNEVQVGGETLLSTSFFQPLDAAHRFFVEPRVAYSSSIEDVFRDDERVARYEFEDLVGLLDVGVNIGRYAQTRIGYLYDSTGGQRRHRLAAHAGDQSRRCRPGPHARSTTVATRHSVRRADSPLRSSTLAATSSLGADRDWERAELGVGVAVPFRARRAVGDARRRLGHRAAIFLLIVLSRSADPAAFPGLELGELRVSDYWTVGTSYLWKVRDVMPVRNLALYLGARVAAGSFHDRIDTDEDGDIYGGSIFLTGRTLVGPTTIGIGATSTDSWSLWLSVGRPVGARHHS